MALDLLLADGLEAAWERSRRLALACRAGVKAIGLELFSPDEDRSAVVTAIRVPEGIDGAAVARAMRERSGVTVAGGQGELKGKIVRIGHIGYVSLDDVAAALEALGLALAATGVSIDPGAGPEAARDAYAGAGGRERPRGDVSERPRVLVRERIAEAGVDLLRDRFDVDVDLDGALEERIGAYDALIVRSATKVTADLLEQAARLRVIGRAGVGVDNVDVDAATKRGILVVNAPESTVVSAAEHAIGLLLALARSIPQAHAALKEGRWERSRFAGIELAEKTLGVVGFGRIGQQVARRARGLAMHVVAYDPFVAPERMREAGVEHVASLEGLLEVSDFVTLHTALTAESRNLIGRARARARRRTESASSTRHEASSWTRRR